MNQWNGTKNLTTARMKLVRDRCVLRHVSRVSCWRKKIAVSLLSVCSYQADDTLFPRGQKLCPTSVRSSANRAAESPQVSLCVTGGFIHCPSSGHRIASERVWKRNRRTARIVHLHWSERVGVSLSVPFQWILSCPMRGRCAEEEEEEKDEEEGGPVSRVHRSEVARGSPTLAERRGQREVGTGLLVDRPEFPRFDEAIQ